METFASVDGTSLAYERAGTGPPLVLVHGTTVHHSYWDPLQSYLTDRFTLYTIDRRGRGRSGDTDNYVFVHEVEDVLTIVEAIADPVFLFGHSFGALCSLEAAARATDVRGLVLYDPPQNSPEALADELQSLVDAGDRSRAVKHFYQVVGGGNVEEWSIWPDQVVAAQNAYTVARETAVVESYELTSISEITIPTLLLVGEESPSYYKKTTTAIDATLPDSRVIVISEQGHGAITDVPAWIANEVSTFLLDL